MSDTGKIKKYSTIALSAAFLMATSAVGPGFLTQTAKFTKDLAASFGFVILVSVIIDIFAQLNIWRVLAVSGKRGQDIANATVPFSGFLLSALIVFGGLAFNIGNIAGAGLGFEVVTGIPPKYGALISGLIAIGIFSFRDASRAMDVFVRVLGFLMLGLIIYVVAVSSPPVEEAALRTVWPETVSPFAIITLVGGTVGGYITFAGAHRLIDAGVTGMDSLPRINAAATTGIFLTAIIRFLLFLAAFGVVSLGLTIADSNPPASVFQLAAGDVGYRLFGIVMWSAAITSVIGAAYTSVSFLKTFSARVADNSRFLIIGFIGFSTVVFLVVGKPVMILVLAGTFNGFILPVGLALVLLASRNTNLMGDYRHPLWLTVSGWLVVGVMLWFTINALFG